MLRSLRGLVCRSLKLHGGRALPRAGLSSVPSQDVPAGTAPGIFHTSESDPARHSEQHEGRLYSIPLEELRAVFPQGLPHRFQQQVQTFNEARLMVRRPALEILACLKGSNFAHPAVRYVIYGERGTGKTLTLCHVVHYCSRQGWLVLHVPDAHLWVKNCKELFQSSYNKARLDQPLQASVWLKNFKTSNERFLEEIKTQKKYIWGRRESTEEGRPLREVVEQVSPEELTLVHSLRKMLTNDWTGGAIVTTLSQTGSLFKPSSAYTPQELLGKEGFDALDPFVPIPVPNYSPKEFESCYGYYLERRWLQHEKARTEEGKAELRFLSGSNPRQLDRLAGPL
ncbi:28S ribosomal protein S29, mitochondrial [Serinus canaria]|uniref:28S ribosomal protein S29, mitochondrial n=1 Tax=Serinus canaria TaxID=9135 RepID=UPI0021CC9ED1|nr:28S ribosomal protein S29, mitochondrial [Serinus canaria]XP_050840873.1 28S ribosomal protein S29, mitochondrial [Serinus canaria]